MMVAAHTDQGPTRTCVGCKERAPQASLLRVALVNGRPVADPRRRLPGRGGYVHRFEACVRLASAQGGFARAFRTRLVPPAVLSNAEGLIRQDRGREEHRS
jgi:predicted RNA-binding protein YlxR (DUF448 family)